MRSSRASPARTCSPAGRVRGADGLTEVALDDGGVVYSVDEAVGDVEVAVYPWDVSISREAPHDSALNHVHGPITSLVLIGNRARVQVRGLVGEVTAASAERLVARGGRCRHGVVQGGGDASRRAGSGVERSVDSGSMAVATDREYGLFIGGESTEPASGEVRDLVEPATGEPLARAAMAGEADVDRAVEAARARRRGRLGPDARDRALAPPARAGRRDRREPRRARRARVAQRRQGDLVGQGRAAPGGRELPLLRLGDRDHRRPLRTRSAARSSSTR